MAIVVKDAASVVKKWQTNASAAGQFYQAGIQNPRRDQTQTAIAAQQTWATAVQQAAAAGSFAKGLQRTQGKWQARSLAVGVQRYPQGITSGVSSYTSGITAVLQVISSITLSQPLSFPLEASPSRARLRDLRPAFAGRPGVQRAAPMKGWRDGADQSTRSAWSTSTSSIRRNSPIPWPAWGDGLRDPVAWRGTSGARTNHRGAHRLGDDVSEVAGRVERDGVRGAVDLTHCRRRDGPG